jgi:hypothetical protein
LTTQLSFGDGVRLEHQNRNDSDRLRLTIQSISWFGFDCSACVISNGEQPVLIALVGVHVPQQLSFGSDAKPAEYGLARCGRQLQYPTACMWSRTVNDR